MYQDVEYPDDDDAPASPPAALFSSIRTSPEIDQLCTALAAAQGELVNPPKSKTGKVRSDKGNYEYKYVDFADGLDKIRPVLSKHGLSFIQVTQMRGRTMILLTRLMHGSGQWIESDYPVCSLDSHQKMGSALTYARRYSLFSLLGVVGEDDDDGSNAADVPHANGTRTRAAARSMEKASSVRYSEPVDQRLANEVNNPPPHDPETGEIEDATPLDPVASKAAAKQMIDKLNTITTRAELQDWAKANRVLKGRLQEADRNDVGAVFTDVDASTKRGRAA